MKYAQLRENTQNEFNVKHIKVQMLLNVIYVSYRDQLKCKLIFLEDHIVCL